MDCEGGNDQEEEDENGTSYDSEPRVKHSLSSQLDYP